MEKERSEERSVRLQDEMERITREMQARDRSLQNASKIVESIDLENRRLKQMLDSKNCLIRELKEQMREGEEEMLQLKLKNKEIGICKTLESKLRSDIESLTESNKMLMLKCEERKLQQVQERHQHEQSIDQEKILKEKLRIDLSQLAQAEQHSINLIEDYSNQIKHLENENETLKQAVMDLRKEKKELCERHNHEIKEIKKMMQTSKDKLIDYIRPNDQPVMIEECTKTILLELLKDCKHMFVALNDMTNGMQEDEGHARMKERETGVKEYEQQQAEEEEVKKSKLKEYGCVVEDMEVTFIEMRGRMNEYEMMVSSMTQAMQKHDEEYQSMVRSLHRELLLAQEDSGMLRSKCSLLEREMKQVADVVRMESGKAALEKADVCEYVRSAFAHLKQVLTPKPVELPPSVPLAEFEDLLEELKKRDAQVEVYQNLSLKYSDMERTFMEKEKELELEIATLRTTLTSRGKEVNDLKSQNKLLIRKYEDMICLGVKESNKENKQQSAGASEYEVKKLRSELQDKEYKLKEKDIEINTLLEDLAAKNTLLSKLETLKASLQLHAPAPHPLHHAVKPTTSTSSSQQTQKHEFKPRFNGFSQNTAKSQTVGQAKCQSGSGSDGSQLSSRLANILLDTMSQE